MSDQQQGYEMVLFRLDSAEKNLEKINTQLNNYVLVRENALTQQNIQETVRRIESDVLAAKQKLTEMNDRLVDQELTNQRRESDQRESQDKLQIRVLYGAIALFITIMSGILINYLSQRFLH